MVRQNTSFMCLFMFFALFVVVVVVVVVIVELSGWLLRWMKMYEFELQLNEIKTNVSHAPMHFWYRHFFSHAYSSHHSTLLFSYFLSVLFFFINY
jgi:hypothetical protein